MSVALSAPLEAAETRPARVSRRSFLGNAALAAAASAIMQARDFLGSEGWLSAAETTGTDLIHETFNGLLAFVVPGPDEYSIAQGVKAAEPGGVDSGSADILIATLDETAPFVANFSVTVAGVLNGFAQAVNPSATGPFVSPFARLSFAEKAAVFRFMDATDPLKPLASLLPALVAAFTYSEAGVFDPVTRSLTGRPIGWQISDYQGVADGRDEFLGYFGKR